MNELQEIRIRHSEKEDIPAIREIYEGRSAYSGTLQLPYPSLKRWESYLENLSKGLPGGVCNPVRTISLPLGRGSVRAAFPRKLVMSLPKEHGNENSGNWGFGERGRENPSQFSFAKGGGCFSTLSFNPGKAPVPHRNDSDR